ncbi:MULTISPECIES: HAD-IA family hydrolase [unclassified Sphingomonas]|uniref:HAD-IA family hydrolase n=1 Tax=unclassified Sphingomonas TaxID=196159 RepID=UPI000BD38974|nr:MAG: phosphoglycolate phosphatase [Sphingomonas sp. 12-62-6]OYX37798.1 MAG: phosphoglycolate phosphatase [Sphingomonas sp. 32-62-10]
MTTDIHSSARPFDIVGFDLDGTLLDTSGDLLNAVNHALTLAERPLLRVDQIKTMIGGGAKHMLQLGLEATGGCPPEDFRPLYKQMLSFYEANVSAETRPFDGALAALDALDAMGVKTAIVTNKFESLAVKLLDELALRDRFVTVIGGDTMGKGFSKPHRAPIDEMISRCDGGRAVFIGDSIYDIMAAKNAGIASVAVSFGFLLEPVEEMGADAVIDHYDELLPTLAMLGNRAPA